jgi:hypothetical protein
MPSKPHGLPAQPIVNAYRQLVNERHPARLTGWTVVAGHNTLVGGFRGWLVLCLRHTSLRSVTSSGVDELGRGGDLDAPLPSF